MGTTGLIYAAIVVAWAVYLIPMALNRSRAQSRRHSVERFSSAMRVLSRRDDRGSGRTIVAPSNVDLVGTPSLAVVDDAPEPLRKPSRASARAAAARRRKVLLTLLVTTAAVGAVSALGAGPAWSALAPVAVIVLFLVVARRQVRRASDAYWRDAAAMQPRTTATRRSAQRREVTHGAIKYEPGDGAVAEGQDAADVDSDVTEDDQPTRDLQLDLTEVEVHDAVAMKAADGTSLWDPIPVTLPTYVDKPAARRQVRTVDLADDGVTSSAHGVSTNAHRSSATGSVPVGDTDVEVETQRAVGQ